MKIVLFTFALLFIYTINAAAQQKTLKIPDSLKTKSSEYLKEQLTYLPENHKIDSVYAQEILARAKSSKNHEQVIEAYKAMMYLSKKDTWFKYCDSIMQVAQDSKNNELIGTAYLSKGAAYYHVKEETKAFDNYILADTYISKTNNQYLIYKTKYAIASIKYFLGFYDEVISLLKECEKYFRENETGKPYLNTLHLLSLSYIKTKKYDLAAAAADLGYRESIKMEEPNLIPYFTNTEGRIEYHNKNYEVAITKLNKSLPYFIKADDIGNKAATYYYLGKCYWELGKKEKAVTFFKKVDEVFRSDKFIKEDLFDAYYLMALYYEEQGNAKTQLLYLTKLLEAETFLRKKYKYLSEHMHREYDLKKIAASTEELKQKLAQRNKLATILGIIFILATAVLAFIFHKQYRRQKQLKQRFKNIIAQKKKKSQPVLVKEKIIDGEQIIKPEIVSAVSKKLEKFEESKLYLDKDFNLNKMAAFVDCNTRYTSRIITETRNKKYIEYVDDLRIEFIVEKLKNDPKYRNYTIKALTEEAGFKSPQKFKEAFTKATELTPLYFIKELKKQDSKE